MELDDFLLVLSRWRDPLQASWIPILDTSSSIKNISAGDNVKCWPLGLFKNQFNFIVIRGSDYPSFPLALPAELPIRIPISEVNGADTETTGDPEEELVNCIITGELLNDAISNDDVLDETAEERLTEISIKYDAALLKQFGQSCTAGNLSEALYLATRLPDDHACSLGQGQACNIICFEWKSSARIICRYLNLDKSQIWTAKLTCPMQCTAADHSITAAI